MLRRSWSRRARIAAWLAAALVLVLAASAVAAAAIYATAPDSNVGTLTFTNPLRVPELLEPRREADGTLVFDLAFTAGQADLVAAGPTSAWGLDGPYLGPTLRARRGDDVVVNVTNGIGSPTTLHWHGMHLPGVMDGGPHQVIEPGDTWSPAWTVDQPAATLWYHPHPHERTAAHVYRGAAGLFLLDDPAAAALGLPSTYGVDDVPLVVQDKAFDGDGSLDAREPIGSQVGVLGDEILVNGTHDPFFEVSTTLVRLRVLNGSNARVYDLGFSDGRPFRMIASDSGLLEAPHESTRLQLSPGERAELVVAMAPAERVVLRSYPPELGMSPLLARMNGGEDTFDILELRARAELEQSPPLPPELVTVDRPDPAEAARTREFVLEGFSRINGRSMDPRRIDEVVTAGTTEIWDIRNASNTYHNFHVHDVHFAVLDVDGRPPPPELAGWKDTIFMPPGRRARIIARFEDYPDADAPYMFHCHVLRHEDMGMMGQFVIAPPGAGG